MVIKNKFTVLKVGIQRIHGRWHKRKRWVLLSLLTIGLIVLCLPCEEKVTSEIWLASSKAIIFPTEMRHDRDKYAKSVLEIAEKIPGISADRHFYSDCIYVRAKNKETLNEGFEKTQENLKEERRKALEEKLQGTVGETESTSENIARDAYFEIDNATIEPPTQITRLLPMTEKEGYQAMRISIAIAIVVGMLLTKWNSKFKGRIIILTCLVTSFLLHDKGVEYNTFSIPIKNRFYTPKEINEREFYSLIILESNNGEVMIRWLNTIGFKGFFERPKTSVEKVRDTSSEGNIIIINATATRNNIYNVLMKIRDTVDEPNKLFLRKSIKNIEELQKSLKANPSTPFLEGRIKNLEKTKQKYEETLGE